MELGDLKYTVSVDTSDLNRADEQVGEFSETAQKAGHSTERFGEASKSAARGVSSSSSSIARSANKVGSTTKRSTKEASEGFNKMSSSAKSASDQLMSMQRIVAALAGSAIIGGAINQIATFEETLNGLRAVSGATAAQMASLEDQARTLGATSRFSAEKAAQGQRFLAQAGLEVNEIMSATPGILNLATAGQLELAEAADIASNVLGGMRLEVSELNRVNDVLAATASGSNTSIRQLGNALSFAAPFAASAGISIEEAAAAIGTMSDAGIQASRAGTGMVGFVRQLSNITPDAASALQDLGLSTADVNIESLGLQKVLDNLSETSMTTEQAIRIFGSEAGAASQVIVNASDRVGEFSEELRNAEGAADAMAAIIGQGLANAMRGFGSALSESVLQLGDGGLGGGLEYVIDTASGVLSVYNSMLPEFVEANDISSTQAGIMQSLATALASAAGGAGLLAAAYGGLAAVTRGLAAAQWAWNAAIAANPIGATIAVVGALAGALWSLRDVTVTIGDETATVGEVISATWQEVTQGLLTAWEEITGPINNLIDSIGEQFGNTSGESVDVWGAAMDGIVFGAKTAVNTLIGVFVGLADSIAQIINNIAWNFETLWTGVADAAKSAFSGDFSGAAEALNRELINPLDNVGRRFSEGLFRDYVGELGTAVSETISAGKTFKSLDKWLFEVGQSSTQAADGINSASNSSSSLTDAAAEAEKAAEKFDDSLLSLLDRLDPISKSQREFARDTAALQTALLSGRITTERYFEAIGQLEQSYRNAGDAAEVYGLDASSALESVQDTARQSDPIAQEMARSWTEAADRIDETFADAFTGAFDSFDDFSDQLLDGFKQLLAELAYQATLKPIVVEFTSQARSAMGIPSAGTSQGGGGAGGLDTSTLIKGGKAAYNYFTGGSAGYSGGWAGSATAASSSAGATLGSSSGVSSAGINSANAVAAGSSSTGMAGLAQVAPQIAAMYAVQQVADGLLKNIGAYDAIGIDASGPAASAGGQFLGLGGTVVGGVVDSVFGGGKTSPRFDLATVDSDAYTRRTGDDIREAFENGWSGVIADSPFGSLGFTDEGTARLKSTFDGYENAAKFLNGIADLDAQLANLASNQGELDAMAEAARSINLVADNPSGIEDQLGERTKRVLGAIEGSWGQFISGLEGGASEIVAQAVTARQAFSTLSDASERLDLRFDDTTASAYEAASSLAEAAGGVQNLSSLQQNYYDTMLTAEQRSQHMRREMQAAFDSLGLSLPRTKEGVRDLVEGLDLMTESGREQYAAIMQLVPSLKKYTDALKQNQETWVDNAFSAVERAAEAQIDSINAQYDRQSAVLDSRIEASQGAIERTQSLVDVLSRSLDSASIAVNRYEREQRMAAQAQLESSLAIVRAGGPLPAGESLEEALGVVAKPSQDLFGSFEDYARDFYATQNVVSELKNNADDALSTEERALESLRSQQESLEDWKEQQIAGVNSQLEYAQAQVDAINGVNTSVVSLDAAMANLAAAVKGMKAAGTDAEGDPLLSGSSGAVADAYRDILGRDPDDSGYAYYADKYSSGRMSIDEIRDRMEDSPEAKGYASGGMHSGGWRLVGERGPEMEYTGPSRIMSNNDTAKMMSNDELVAEIKGLREDMRDSQRAISKNTGDIRKVTERWDLTGVPTYDYEAAE